MAVWGEVRRVQSSGMRHSGLLSGLQWAEPDARSQTPRVTCSGEDGAAFTLLFCLQGPALMGLPQLRLPDTMGNFPKLEPQLPSFLQRPVSHFPLINKHFRDTGEAEPPRGQSSVAVKVAHSSVSFIVQQLSH